MAVTLTLDLKLDEENGKLDDMAAVVAELFRLSGLPLNAMRFGFVLANRDDADYLEEALNEIFEERPWPVEAEVKRVDKNGLRRRVQMPPGPTPIDREITRRILDDVAEQVNDGALDTARGAVRAEVRRRA